MSDGALNDVEFGAGSEVRVTGGSSQQRVYFRGLVMERGARLVLEPDVKRVEFQGDTLNEGTIDWRGGDVWLNVGSPTFENSVSGVINITGVRAIRTVAGAGLGRFVNEGTISVDDGAVFIEPAFTQGNSGVMLLNVVRVLNQAEVPRVSLEQAQLAGRIGFQVSDPLGVHPGDVFEVVSYSSVEGAFDGVTAGTLESQSFTMEYLGDRLQIKVIGGIEELPAPKLRMLEHLNKFFGVHAQVEPRIGFRLETSDDLRTWKSVFSTNVVDGTIRWIDESSRVSEHRFYRLVLPR